MGYELSKKSGKDLRIMNKELGKKTKILKLSIFTVAVFGVGLFQDARAAIIFEEGFESAAIDGDKWFYNTSGSDWNIVPVNSPARSGNNSVKFYIRRVDNNSYRAEIGPRPLLSLIPNRDYWFGFSLYIPTDWVDDIEGETVFQVPSYPDLDLGELWRSPPLQLQFDEETNKWIWFNIWDPKKVTIGNDPRPEGGWGSVWSGDLTKGQWTDWVLHYKPHYLSSGVLEIWKDGQLVVNKIGPNVYNDKRLFVKMGVYKSKWKYGLTNVSERTLYIDEFKAGDGNSSYEEVVPGPAFSPTDVNEDTKVNIKDIQACIKVITRSDLTYENQCRVLATPNLTTNIKDIQVIIREIIK